MSGHTKHHPTRAVCHSTDNYCSHCSAVHIRFIIDPSGYIVSNNHVGGNATRVVVSLQDGSEHQARVIGTDEFPVLVSTELSGSPQSLTLSFKRDSPEPAKTYSSL